MFIQQNNALLHGLRTPNEAFFHWNTEFLGLGGQIWQINSGAFGIFSAKLLSASILLRVPCPCFFQPLFLQKTKPLYPRLKYLFGIGI